ncbi:putative porin [Paraburkholderia tropica]|uniref:Outer membrane protein (Porin) n=1 Tax=Paraburkholderia tropica TaxID=92647 RepID=A0AAQ1JYI5_9BURK|nr:porin [Paraburkholderia tropica]MBB3005045.1 putative porin [Paraburkholderia tropica]MBB6324018.1 putative porin [Paraburkholderia tropica]QNB17338.1 porin [Paraburkholderia tropica]RQN34180.1 porin [Paraburkholderia tropica]SEK15212.1 Outer membrane protein (porin) [Paraburkholderia tropica]
MKRLTPRYAALVALPLLAASNAHAQSSVTVYGLVDTFVQYVDTGKGYTAAMNSSGQYGSRIGFRGSEDIGGGNKIDFDLENGFNSNDGTFSTAGSLFNRQAWVGASGNWGSVRAGRQNSLLFLNEGRLDAFGGATQASGIDNLSVYTYRTSNTVGYFSPKFAGFQASGYIGLGDAGGFRSGGSNYQFALTYDNQAISAVYAMQGVRNANATSTERSTFAGGSYDIGAIRLYAGYAGASWDDMHINIRSVEFSGRWTISPFAWVALGYTFLQDRIGSNDAAQYSALFDYALSKRTSFYAAVSWLDNRGTAQYRLAGAANAGLALAYPGAPARGVQVGVVQAF